MRRLILFLFTLFVATGVWAQPRYDMQHIQREKLDRGVVAIRQGGKVTVSWRTLLGDRRGEPFDVLRNGVKLNSAPLTEGGTMFVDEHPLAADAVYEVRGGGRNGTYTLRADAPEGYIAIALQKPEGGAVPTMQQPQNRPNRQNGRSRWRGWRDNGQYTYSANDCSAADVDGDGQYEIVVKWEPSNAHDNSHDGYTGPTLFDCYRLDGTLLWRINMGRNIRSGAHYVPFIFYDLDGDGRAELIVKTADGTCDAKGHAVGDSTADHRNQAGRVLTGPEYITVFNGLTGEAMDTKPYHARRGDPADWGDARGNRSERYLAAVGYFDGKRASAAFCRGYYTRTVIETWNWDGRELKLNWVFDTDTPQWKSYAGQGNHNLRVADVDGDGKDEITYGSMAVDHDGTGLYNTGFGHGDALHLMAFDPESDRLLVWDCHENRRDGSDFRDAATGKVIFQIKSRDDVGRAMAADIDPTNPGVEMWSTDSHGIRNIKGEIVKRGNSSEEDNTKLVINGRYLPVNFGIWWDGDLLRELLDRGRVSKYDWKNGEINDIMVFDECQFNNGTKSNPCLSADLLGDWREEVLTRTRDSRELRLFVSTVPTRYRIPCLMEDIPYRLSVATENVGYNQPPEPGFYLGAERTEYVTE